MKANYIRVVRLLVSFLLVFSCSALYGETSEDSVHILVSRFGDPDQMGIPAAEIVRDWLEDVFCSYDYITVDLLDQSFSFDENELNEAVSAAYAIGGDIVFVGAYLYEDDRIPVAMVSIISTDCSSTYQMINMIYEDENSFTPYEMTSGSSAPDRFKFYAYPVLGDWMSRMNRFEESAVLLRSALLFAEGVSEERVYAVCCLKGNINRFLGRYWSSISDYSDALEIYSGDPSVLSLRATCYDAVGNLDDAIDDLLAAVELDPDNARYNGQLGAQLKQAEKFSEALFYLDRAIELDPSNAMTFRDRSRAYYGLEDYEPALADINHAIEIEPDNSQGHAMRGHILFEMCDTSDALESFSISIDLETNIEVLAWSLAGRANCYLLLEEHQSALEDLAEALECDPTFYTVYYFMGVCNAELGFTYSATENLTEFLRHPLILSPVDPWTRTEMHEEAEELLERLQTEL